MGCEQICKPEGGALDRLSISDNSLIGRYPDLDELLRNILTSRCASIVSEGPPPHRTLAARTHGGQGGGCV